MKRARLLSALVVGAAGLLLLLPVTPAGLGADAPLISLAAIPDQTLDIYPGTIPTKATIVPLTVNPADAEIAIRTSSTDKAEVVIDDEDLIIAPEQAGTMYVKVTAAEPGYASASQTFAVHVIAKTENDYNWSGSAKIGGSGYVTGAVFSPIEEDVLYAMADIGGAYRYDFTRDYWVGLNDDATDHSSAYNPTDNRGPGRGATFVASIVPDPVQTGRVYMAAGGSATNAAIYRSDDYGDHWSRFPIGTSINGNDQSNRSTGPRLAIDPKNNNIVYFASQTAGLWRSVDAGQTFARLSDATDLAVDYRPTFVTIDPNSPVDGDGNSTRIIVGTIGATSNTPPTTDVDPMQQRPYKSLFISNDGGGTFAELAGQPAARPDRRYGGFVAEHPAWDWTGKLVVAYAEFGLSGFNGVGSNSNFALDGRVYRFDVGAGTSENVTPLNVYTKEHPALTETDIANGQVMQRGGIGGISVDAQRPGVMVASSFHRHANYSEEVVWYTNDYGTNWKVIHSEVVGIKDLRGYGYIDKDNGWGAAVHWAFDIQINPYDSDMALFNTGNGFWMAKNLTVADQPITRDNQVVWGFWDDGLEETVIWNLYSPTQTEDNLYSTYADWGSMSWLEDYTISPSNSLVNTESPANRVRYLDPAFDENGNPRYDLDGEGNVQTFLKPGYQERWMNTQNLDYAGLKQNVMVLTPSGNYQNTNTSAGVISFDEGKTATPFAVPSGITGEGPSGTGSAGWIAISADANTVVWSVGNQRIANTYWTDVSAGADSAAVGSHVGRPQGVSEVRQVVKNGDRAAWTKAEYYDASGTLITSTSTSAKVFSDKLNPNLFYAFSGTNFYVSENGGRRFDAKVPTGVAIPNASWTSSGHSQGGSKVQVDVFNSRSIWLASNNATAGLVHITYDAASSTWTATKVNSDTVSAFQQVGEGIGVGDNSVPALYAMGIISDTSVTPAADPYCGAYRSLDGGATWKRINDNQHQFGDLRALSGDSRVFGRTYIGTGSRGIRVGEIVWAEDEGSSDSPIIPAAIVAARSASSALVQYSDGVPATDLTVTGSVEDEFGSSLTADAIGLPAGLSLTVASNSDEGTFPGRRTWRLSGTTTAAPGAYPVTVTVRDADGWNDETSFAINVTTEDARATFTAPTSVSTGSTTSSLASVMLSATVEDISATFDAAGDTTSGDIRNATVTFVDRSNGEPICKASFGLLNGGSSGKGTAMCTVGVDIGSASEFTFTVGTVIGGYYVRNAAVENAVVKVAKPRVKVPNPTTRIVRSRINQKQKRASFRFSGTGRGNLSFQCSLDGKKFASCRSGVLYEQLKKGAHNFRVRAKAGGKVDPTPAKKKFKI